MTAETLRPILLRTPRQVRLMTDEQGGYHTSAADSRATKPWTTGRRIRSRLGDVNTAEVFLDLQARRHGHLSPLRRRHLHRYLSEFDFRWKNRVELG